MSDGLCQVGVFGNKLWGATDLMEVLNWRDLLSHREKGLVMTSLNLTHRTNGILVYHNIHVIGSTCLHWPQYVRKPFQDWLRNNNPKLRYMYIVGIFLNSFFGIKQCYFLCWCVNKFSGNEFGHYIIFMKLHVRIIFLKLPHNW